MKKQLSISLCTLMLLITLNASSQWNLTGNSVPPAPPSFLGTNNAFPLDFKVNGNKAGRIEFSAATANTFFGYQSGNANTGNFNTAVGFTSLLKNTVGSYNTSAGRNALLENINGTFNTAIGANALQNNYGFDITDPLGNNSIFGRFNTAVGVNALQANKYGYQNTALGTHTLDHNTFGFYNTATGENALSGNKNGNYNTANGYNALKQNTSVTNSAGGTISGDFNTAIGSDAGINNTTGSSNTFIGAETNVSSGGYNYVTALGYGAIVTGTNRVQIGNGAILGVYSWNGLFTTSDVRFKNNIEETVPGLTFIAKLRPVTYHYNMDNIAKHLNTPDSLRSKESEALKSKMLYSGFIAQEVEKAAKEIGYDFSGVSKPQNEKDYYALNYAEFTVPLVKAVQELNNKNIELQKRIEALEILIKGKNK